MEYLRICNWDKWQTYRKDRGQPPWIKVHRCLMRNVNWIDLTDAQRGQLVCIWMLAADIGGQIPASPAVVRKLCYMDAEPDFELFMEHGFIEHDANVASARRQDDANMTLQRQRQSRDREEKRSMSGKPDDNQEKKIKNPTKADLNETARRLLGFLNEKTGCRYRPVESNLKMLRARLAEYDEITVRQVIANRVRDWIYDDNMRKYLRPKTLFNATNFSSYAGQLGQQIPQLEEQHAH